jgi:hypothetical protein
MAIQFQILLWPKRIGIGLFWLRFYALGYIGEDFAGAEHTVCIETGVSGYLISFSGALRNGKEAHPSVAIEGRIPCHGSSINETLTISLGGIWFCE